MHKKRSQVTKRSRSILAVISLLAGLVLSFYVYNHAQARTAPTSNLAATATANSTGEAGEAFPEAAGPQFLELQPTTSPLPSNTATLAAYLRLLNDRDSLVRQSAINGLGKLGSRQAIPPLLGLLSDPAKAVRDSASKALLALGAKEQTISAWVGLLSDRNEEIRQGAAAGLREMGDLQTISTLNPILTNPDPAVRQVAGEVRTYLKIKLLALNVALGSHD